MLGFIIANILILMEIIIFSYDFELLSSVLPIQHLSLFNFPSSAIQVVTKYLVFVYLMLLFLHHFKKTVCGIGQVNSFLSFLTGFSFSTLYPPTASWPSGFLLRNLLILSLIIPFMRGCLSLAAFKILFVFCEFDFDVFQYGSF